MSSNTSKIPKFQDEAEERALAGLALVGLLVVSLAGCHPNTEPASTGGEMVDGTEGIDCGDHLPLSYSPDGQWLAFWLWTNRGENAPPKHRLALLDLDTGIRHLPDPDGRESNGDAATAAPRIDKLCWSRDGQRLLTGVLPPDANEATPVQPSSASLRVKPRGQQRPAVVHAIDLDRPDRMERVDTAACGAEDIGHWRFEPPYQDDWTQLGKAQVKKLDPRLIRLERSGGRVLGEHRPVRWSTRSLMVSDHAWSPDQTQLAYVVRELRGSWGGLSHTWLTAVDAEPVQLLSGAVYAMQWRNDQELHLCLRRPGQAESAVFAWQSPFY
ncbi:hypothetical protein [Thioalkalivibrio sp. ALJT]|uniref:hypothetical protein n=1 Tax=Thioalkalivibrio sp. ALJT TaxID=1158146 RepID=UPI0003A64EDD|nr:hypothetical protein [Thioalkalivibrio sp. ALJT]